MRTRLLAALSMVLIFNLVGVVGAQAQTGGGNHPECAAVSVGPVEDFPADGTITVDGFTLTFVSVDGEAVYVTVTSDTYDVLWVAVKGGTEHAMYAAGPFVDLTAPINPNTDKPFAISHVDVCGETPTVPTTTVPPTTTTTVPPTTTTTTTTVPPTTTTTVTPTTTTTTVPPTTTTVAPTTTTVTPTTKPPVPTTTTAPVCVPPGEATDTDVDGLDDETGLPICLPFTGLTIHGFMFAGLGMLLAALAALALTRAEQNRRERAFYAG